MSTTKILTKISFFFDEVDFDDDFFPKSKFLNHFPGLLPFPMSMP